MQPEPLGAGGPSAQPTPPHDIEEVNPYVSQIWFFFLGLVTYVLENEEETIAYFSLENDRLAVAKVDGFWEESEKYANFKDLYSDCNSFPAVKIAQLAVNEKYQRQHIGKNLVEFIIGSFVNNTNKTGCQFILVDALESEKSRFFYDRLNFQYATVNDYNKPTRLRYLCLLGISFDVEKKQARIVDDNCD